jgi:hypothetical protein
MFKIILTVLVLVFALLTGAKAEAVQYRVVHLHPDTFGVPHGSSHVAKSSRSNLHKTKFAKNKKRFSTRVAVRGHKKHKGKVLAANTRHFTAFRD